MAKIEGIISEPGYLVVAGSSGPPVRYPVAEFLRAADIPSLTHEQVDGIRLLANLVAILIRTLIERGILDESFADSLGMDYDLDGIIYAVEQLGGAYHEPDFDNVEVA